MMVDQKKEVASVSLNIIKTMDHEPTVVKKHSDPGSFTLPYYIGDHRIGI